MENCTLSREQHIRAIFTGAQALGVGLGCRGGYEALREITHGLEQIHGIDPKSYTPGKSEYVREIVAATKEQQEIEKQTLIDATADSPKN